MPGAPSPAAATRVSRSWTAMPWRSVATVSSSAPFVAACCSAVCRSRPCSWALDTATPVCWASTWARNCSSTAGSQAACTIREPIRPAMLRMG